MNWLTKQTNRIPEYWRLLIRRYGVWVVLVLGVGFAWYANSRQLFVNYDTTFRASVGNKKADTWAYHFGYSVAMMVLRPARSIPVLGVVWALAVLHYRYLFARLWLGTSGAKKVLYGVVLLLLRWAAVTGMTGWLGPGDINSAAVNLLLLCVILFGYFAHFRRLRRHRHQLTEQKTRAELDALKAQINPHFLFNSLNNIFGTALTENGPRTADSVQQLARILRYMLEQADTDRASVETELRFLDEYVMLQKQRLPKSATGQVQFGYEWDEEPAQIAPLLLSPLLDYAFRRSQAGESLAPVSLRASAVVNVRQLHFRLGYTCPGTHPDPADELQNVRQRLALIYPDRHSLTVREENADACIDLTINLN